MKGKKCNITGWTLTEGFVSISPICLTKIGKKISALIKTDIFLFL
jgi:hypothetical protein